MNAQVGTHKQNGIILTVRADGVCFADYIDERFMIHGRKQINEMTIEQLFERAESMLRTEGTKDGKGAKLSLATLNATVGKHAREKTV